VSLVRYHRRRHELEIFQGELRKLKTLTFDGENKKEEGFEA